MIKMTINEFFTKYGNLLPAYYKRMMRALYDHSYKGSEMIMPDPTGEMTIVITKK